MMMQHATMQPVFPSFRVFPDMLTHAMLSLAAYACPLVGHHVGTQTQLYMTAFTSIPGWVHCMAHALMHMMMIGWPVAMPFE